MWNLNGIWKILSRMSSFRSIYQKDNKYSAKDNPLLVSQNLLRKRDQKSLEPEDLI